MSTNTNLVRPVEEFVTCRASDLDSSSIRVSERAIDGVEVFMDDIVPRTESLEDLDSIVQRLMLASVRRVHCSYWGSPTGFVANIGFGELVDRFSDCAAMREYFGDLTGQHMFDRWCDEYTVARRIGARAYVFHLIDYLHVDGAWEFSVSRETVLHAMVVLLQRLMRELAGRGLLTPDGPVIEVENAGWGLEFGVQTADDFSAVFSRVWDPHGLLRIGWDLNHLLHAIGTREGRAVFMLPDAELSQTMRVMEANADGDVSALAREWVQRNVCDPRTAPLVSALHLSDCPAKTVEYFTNGRIAPDYRVDGDLTAQAKAGLDTVLAHYDNHTVLGEGVLDPGWVAELIARLRTSSQQPADQGQNDRRSIASSSDFALSSDTEGPTWPLQVPPLMLLHELKNANDVWSAADVQRERLGLTAVSLPANL